MPNCDVCRQFVARRKRYIPYIPEEINLLPQYVMVCTKCYNDCMKQCSAILNKNDCHKHLCWNEYQAKEYASREHARQHQRTIASIERKPKLWPNVPKE